MRAIFSAIINNFAIKILSLFLAILTWSYVVAQLYNQLPEYEKMNSAVVKMEDRNVIVKKLPIHVNLIGTPDKRYTVAVDKIRVIPPECTITGPLDKIENFSFITTEPISVNGVAKTIKKRINLKELPGYTLSKEGNFVVVIPIIRKRTR